MTKQQFIVAPNPRELHRQLNELFEAGWRLCPEQVGSMQNGATGHGEGRKEYFTSWACVYLKDQNQKPKETETNQPKTWLSTLIKFLKRTR
jgi:hypothetical protein